MPSLFAPSFRHLALCGLLAAAALPAIAADEPRAIIAKLAPAAGWTAPDPVRVAVGDELFDLIDGGAELYHEYGFKRAASWQLETTARNSIQIEVYEMNEAPAAYGVFSLMQTGQFTRGNLGQGSLRFGYYTVFWSGPYYASVTGARADAATQAEVDRLAAALAALLPRGEAQPDWFAHLPATGLQERKYFRGRIALSNIATGPAGELIAGREGLFATYPGAQLLLFHFATPAEAAAQLAKAAQSAAQNAELGHTTATSDGFTSIVDGGSRLRGFVSGTELFLVSATDDASLRSLELQLHQSSAPQR